METGVFSEWGRVAIVTGAVNAMAVVAEAARIPREPVESKGEGDVTPDQVGGSRLDRSMRHGVSVCGVRSFVKRIGCLFVV